MVDCYSNYSKLDILISIIENKGIKGIQAQAVSSVSKLLENGDVVPFDTVLSNIGNVVTLDSSNGIFTIKKRGTYVISYYVNINGTEGKVDVKFTCNGIPTEATYAVQGQLFGQALLQLKAGDKVSVTNSGGEIISLGSNSIQAGILIHTIQ